MSKQEVIKSKRFFIRKSLIGANAVIEFTDVDGKVQKYNHDIVYKAHKKRFDEMPCFEKYGSYTNSKRLPRFVREMKKIV